MDRRNTEAKKPTKKNNGHRVAKPAVKRKDVWKERFFMLVKGKLEECGHISGICPMSYQHRKCEQIQFNCEKCWEQFFEQRKEEL